MLTEEAKGYAAKGSPEAQLVAAISPEGASKDALKVVFFSGALLLNLTGGFCFCGVLRCRFGVLRQYWEMLSMLA